jgi:thiol-disulfide isomerase/thioredoxin
MNRFLSLGLVGVLVLLLASVAPGTADDTTDGPHAKLIGKPAPEIAGDFALNGKPVKLADLKGKVVLLDFWAVWCGPCIRTFPHLKAWNQEYKDKGLEIVGVTLYNCEAGRNYGFDKATGKLTRAAKVSKEDEQELLKDFAQHHKLQHRLMAMSAADWNKVFKAYMGKGIPMAVVIDRQGNVRMVKVGSGEANAKALEGKIRELLDEKG